MRYNILNLTAQALTKLNQQTGQKEVGKEFNPASPRSKALLVGILFHSI
jgi:hypothetical protein